MWQNTEVKKIIVYKRNKKGETSVEMLLLIAKKSYEKLVRSINSLVCPPAN